MSSRMEQGLALLHSVRLVSETRQRSKFIPFLLRNNTGLPLKILDTHFSAIKGGVREGGRGEEGEREGRGERM